MASEIFKNSEDHLLIRAAAFSGIAENMQMLFNNGDVVEAAFVISNYSRRGRFSDDEIYTFRLDSSGDVTYTKA